jgi:hypothetical protein
MRPAHAHSSERRRLPSSIGSATLTEQSFIQSLEECAMDRPIAYDKLAREDRFRPDAKRGTSPN